MPRWLEPVIPHLQLEGSAAAAAAAVDAPGTLEPAGPADQAAPPAATGASRGEPEKRR